MGEAARDFQYQAATKLYKSLDTFVRLVLGATPSRQQQEIIDAIDSGKRRIAVRSGHGVGKSTLLAWILLWFVTTHPEARIPCTAPTSHQLSDILWAEVASWFRRMEEPYKSTLEMTGDTVRHKSSPAEWFAVARTARKENPDALQGFHGKHLMFLVDEASGVPEEVFTVAEGALSTEGAFIIMMGNPTRREGTFFEAFHSDRDHWELFTLSSAESPFVDPGYVTRMADRYGKDSDIFRVRVLGDFPISETDSLISLTWVEDAMIRGKIHEAPKGFKEPIVYGLDVARFGDDETVLLKRRGREVISVDGWHGADLMETCGKVVAQSRRDRPLVIFVDVIGLGAGVADRLLELGLTVRPVNVANRAREPERFADLRSELWWGVREYLEENLCSLPNDQELAAQLSTIKYKLTSAGKIIVESKSDRKKRLAKAGAGGSSSPDRGDALMLTFAEPTAYVREDDDSRAYYDDSYDPVDKELGI